MLIICFHTVEWFKLLLCLINTLIKHQSFVYTLLNVKTVLFKKINLS